uniref:Uncharacterized protein n=1 Tax=Triticum urartu TaxID=4572 RepID=A0A8R7QZ12_TRIUA
MRKHVRSFTRLLKDRHCRTGLAQ